MCKVYIAVTDTNEKAFGCVLDIEQLPKRPERKEGNIWEQGSAVGEWLKADVNRAKSSIQDITMNRITQETELLIDRLRKLGACLQRTAKGNHPLDALITFLAPDDHLDFLFTNPSSAEQAYNHVIGDAG